MKPDEIRVVKSSCFFSFTNNSEKAFQKFKIKTFPHYTFYLSVLRKLSQIGFKIIKNPRIEKDYKILSVYNRYGKWRDLEVEIEIYPNGFKFEFYQNLNTGDRAAGDGMYCFDKYSLMTYLIKKQFEYTVREIKKFIESRREITFSSGDRPVNSTEEIIQHTQQRHFAPKNQIQELADIESYMTSYDFNCNSTDRDKKTIKCGEVKYFRDYRTGRLYRGLAYHNINNMWWIIINKFDCRNVASFELFNPNPEDYRVRRIKKGSMPDWKKKELEILNSASSATLLKLMRKKLKPA